MNKQKHAFCNIPSGENCIEFSIWYNEDLTINSATFDNCEFFPFLNDFAIKKIQKEINEQKLQQTD
jgi:hypothetical protein